MIIYIHMLVTCMNWFRLPQRFNICLLTGVFSGFSIGFNSGKRKGTHIATTQWNKIRSSLSRPVSVSMLQIDIFNIKKKIFKPYLRNNIMWIIVNNCCNQHEISRNFWEVKRTVAGDGTLSPETCSRYLVNDTNTLFYIYAFIWKIKDKIAIWKSRKKKLHAKKQSLFKVITLY